MTRLSPGPLLARAPGAVARRRVLLGLPVALAADRAGPAGCAATTIDNLDRLVDPGAHPRAGLADQEVRRGPVPHAAVGHAAAQAVPARRRRDGRGGRAAPGCSCSRSTAARRSPRPSWRGPWPSAARASGRRRWTTRSACDAGALRPDRARPGRRGRRQVRRLQGRLRRQGLLLLPARLPAGALHASATRTARSRSRWSATRTPASGCPRSSGWPSSDDWRDHDLPGLAVRRRRDPPGLPDTAANTDACERWVGRTARAVAEQQARPGRLHQPDLRRRRGPRPSRTAARSTRDGMEAVLRAWDEAGLDGAGAARHPGPRRLDPGLPGRSTPTTSPPATAPATTWLPRGPVRERGGPGGRSRASGSSTSPTTSAATETCRAVIGGVVTYFDGSHLTATYASTLRPLPRTTVAAVWSPQEVNRLPTWTSPSPAFLDRHGGLQRRALPPGVHRLPRGPDLRPRPGRGHPRRRRVDRRLAARRSRSGPPRRPRAGPGAHAAERRAGGRAQRRDGARAPASGSPSPTPTTSSTTTTCRPCTTSSSSTPRPTWSPPTGGSGTSPPASSATGTRWRPSSATTGWSTSTRPTDASTAARRRPSSGCRSSASTGSSYDVPDPAELRGRPLLLALPAAQRATRKVGFLRSTRYHYRKRDDQSSSLGSSMTHPGRYTDVFTYGYLRDPRPRRGAARRDPRRGSSTSSATRSRATSRPPRTTRSRPSPRVRSPRPSTRTCGRCWPGSTPSGR